MGSEVMPKSFFSGCSRKFNEAIIFVICGVVGVFLISTICTVVYFFNEIEENIFIRDKRSSNELLCANIQNGEKFDCFPRGEADEKSCISKGCCWYPTSERSLVPLCFFPKNFKSYVVVENTEESPSHRRLKLKVAQPRAFQQYPNTIETVQVDINYETKSRLRINITDAERTRFKPPYPLVPIGDGYSADDADYEVLFNEDPFGFAVVRKKTKTVIFDTRGIGSMTLADQFLQVSAMIPTKHLYGLGERRNNFLLNTTWETITLFNHDSNPMDSVNLYGSHPFYLAVENDGFSHGIFLLNSNAMDIIVQPAPAITYRTIGGVLDFYFFMGPTPNDVIKQYMEIIGNPILPPYWSFGFHLCRWGWTTLNDTIAAWKRNREAGILFDVQWNDIDHMEGYNNFLISTQFKGLRQFVDQLHELEMKYIITLDPGIASKLPRSSYPPYDEGLKQNIFIKNATNLPTEGIVWNKPNGTVFLDFSDPKTSSYWLHQITELYRNIPYDGLWLDMNEISNFVNGSIYGCPTENNSLDSPPYVPGVRGGRLNYHTICMSDKHAIGSHYDVHNIYGYLQCVVTSFCLEKITKKRPFILSRSTFAGSGHYAAHWTGDVYSTWSELKHSVADIINFNLFGIPMIGADICGFSGNTTKELCQRWSQLGAFYPFSRNHNAINNIDQDPAVWGVDFVYSTKKALTLRYRLLPYLYTLFWKAHQFGDAVVRPLFFEFPTDANTLTIDTQFLWGPAVLILPVLNEGATSVHAFFPKGLWISSNLIELVDSKGENRTISAPMDEIPVYFRGGFIIPFQEPSITTAASRRNPFGLYVILDESKKASGTLFWDDGESYMFRDADQYNLLQFTCTETGLTSVVSKWGYDSNMAMYNIFVSGVHHEVTEMNINNDNHRDFVYISQNQLLIINYAIMDLSNPFNISWTF